MNRTTNNPPNVTTRREFIADSGKLVAGAALASAIATRAFAGESNTIKIALVGCGGRGSGAAVNALSTAGPTKLWAVADVFEHRIASSLGALKAQFPNQIAVTPERQFVGFDGYKKAIDCLDKGDVVLLTTPPAFRPIHFEYAVQKGVNVFMEKSFAVDAPGLRRILRAGQVAAQKNLKIATGLMSRHYTPLEEAIDQIHQGAIGEIIAQYAYRMHGPVGLNAKQPGTSELLHQIANYSCFTWLNGSFVVDWLIHNIDVCCWIKNAWPVSVQAMGGRQTRSQPDQLFDHYAEEFTFADGTRMMVQGRHSANCWDFFGDVIHGTKGCAALGEGVTDPRLYKTHNQTTENLIWRYKGQPCLHYQREHDLFFAAIRNNEPYNETERSAKSCFTAIMGRMACESGQKITWDEAMASNEELAPGLDSFTFDSKPPVQPDASGRYAVAMPGIRAAI